MANSPTGDSMLDRIVAVLATFTNARTSQTAAEIGRRAGLAPSTAHRLVAELVDSGLLEREEDHRVRLGMRLWELAMRGSRALRLRQAALPRMEQVQAAIGQHTQLAVIEDGEALFLERLSTPTAGSNVARVAGRLPLHASSAGLVLLAFADEALQESVLAGPLPASTPQTVTDPAALRRILAEIRDRGWVIARGFVESHSTAIAVPVRDPRGSVVASLAVVMPHGAVAERVVLDRLLAASTGIGRALGDPHRD